MVDPARLKQEIQDKRGYIYPWQEYVTEHDPEFIRGYEQMWDTIGDRAVHLDERTKQLVLIGVVCSRLDDVAMRTQIERGLRLGLTQAEILEALEVAFLPSGALTLVHGVKALMDVLEDRDDDGEAAS